MTTPNPKRLIEVAFPLKQVSLDSVHEKNVRHGHISTLHIWPAQRPLAASRAALIATLLPDPGDAEERKDILLRMAGKVTEKVESKRVNGRVVERVKEETAGGILHWGRENGPDLEWFRKEIRKAYGGRAPKVLDPFAGGGAIPLEAMRLGCEVTAMDINPVAWFILKCTLEYPQKLAGQTRPLPEFALADREFMEAFLKAKGFKGARLRTFLERMGHGKGEGVQLGDLSQDDSLDQADLAWHVRAWGRWVLARARKELASYYPTYAEFQPLTPTGEEEQRPLRLLDLDENGVAQLEPLNEEFNDAYLKDPHNPRWVAKPTVAYLWARTVTCKQCRATLPLLKTRWLCKKDNKRVLLTMETDADQTGVIFGVHPGVPQNGGNAAQRREHDKRIGAGTMSRTGATCPWCGVIMTMSDIRLEGQAGRLGAVMTAVVVDGVKGKEYRLPTAHEVAVADISEDQVGATFAEIPFGLPEELICAERPSPNSRGASGLPRYAINSWYQVFTSRQLVSLGRFLLATRKLPQELDDWPKQWNQALPANLSLANDRLADYSSMTCSWSNTRETIRNTFARFALPFVWDYAESNPLSNTTGNFLGAVEWVSLFVAHALKSLRNSEAANVQCSSATDMKGEYDLILTDPPYYDAIPYSDIMDFFYVWLKRSVCNLSPQTETAFQEPLGPKWDKDRNDGELVDQLNRFDDDRVASRKNYEDGMLRAFQSCWSALKPGGRLVIVFANKQPNAWETLASALIRAGFVVDASWPIQTEMINRVAGGARLSSSVWLVCKKRPAGRPGWDNTVLDEMRENITQKLRDFWDAGIRGPDFVWAATGPALEAFSKHPVVRKANAPNELMTVSEFLREVRRMVVDFVVGRVLTRGGEEAVTGLDDVTTYYLLHRNDFGLDDAPVGGCILYALSCNLSDSSLANQYDLLLQSKNGAAADSLDEDAAEDEEGDDASEGGSGAKVKLKPWHRRRGRSLGMEAPGGRSAPLIDQVHKLMHLWREGDQARVNEYLDSRGLQRNALFHQLLQALIELAPPGSDERAVLEAISNHAAAHGDVRAPRYRQPRLGEAT
jgi:adenine-specific DNA methylase